MHELFRVLGQQMGIQKVRGILPESIDILLYTAIVHCVRQIITSNVTTNFGNIVATQKNKISVINALRTLYKEEEIEITYEANTTANEKIIPNPVIVEGFYEFNIFSIIDCNISYNDSEPYNYISARLIEPNLIGETIQDYLLRPTYKYPVATITSVNDNYTKIENQSSEIEEPDSEDSGDENENSDESVTKHGTLIVYNLYTNNSKPTRIKTSFIKYPQKVHYDETEENRIDCDLPIHLHHMVVEEAVKLYLQSINLTSGSDNISQQNNKNNIQ